MILVIELDEAELNHTLKALIGVATIIERHSDELAAAVIIRDVIIKIVRAIKESQ